MSDAEFEPLALHATRITEVRTLCYGLALVQLDIGFRNARPRVVLVSGLLRRIAFARLHNVNDWVSEYCF
jgi:hypothetical protein